MNLPGFTADYALQHAARTTYRGRLVDGAASAGRLVPALDTLCGRCETVGGFGGIRGVGRRSCCQTVWKYDPITKRYAPVSSCWFESCTPEPAVNRWLSF